MELAYAVENKLAFASIRNKSGAFVTPSIESTTAAAAAMKTIPADFRVSLVNQPGKNAYPITGLTWLLVYEQQKDPAKGKKLVEFLKWSMGPGQKMAGPLLYAPLPKDLAGKVEKTIQRIR